MSESSPTLVRPRLFFVSLAIVALEFLTIGLCIGAGWWPSVPLVAVAAPFVAVQTASLYRSHIRIARNEGWLR